MKDTDSKYTTSALMQMLRKGIPVPLISYKGEKVTARRLARDAVTGEILILYTLGTDDTGIWLSRPDDSFFCYAADNEENSPTKGQIVPYYSVDFKRIKESESLL